MGQSMIDLSEEARAVADVLLAHHREVCRSVKIDAERISNDLVNERTLTYGVICERARMADLTHIVGRFIHFSRPSPAANAAKSAAPRLMLFEPAPVA